MKHKRERRTDGDAGERFAKDWRLNEDHKDVPSSKRLYTMCRRYRMTMAEITRLSGMVVRARGRYPSVLAPWLR